MKEKTKIEGYEIKTTHEEPVNIEQKDFAQLNQMEMKHTEVKDNPAFSPENKTEVKEGKKDLQSLGFPTELVDYISILAEDKNKASEYFRPVVETSRRLMEGYNTAGEAAMDFGDLLESIFYYLDNRGSSFFSKQRNTRRSTCNQVLDRLGNYLYTADPEFKTEIQTRVGYLKSFGNAEGAENENNASANRFATEFGYTISDDSIKTEIAKRRFKNLPPEALTGQISKIRLSMEGLESMLTNKMPPMPAENASAEEKKAYEDEVKFVGFGISKMYRQIIAACGSYIETKNADKKLVVLTRDLMTGCEHDAKVFANGISEYIAGHKGSDVVTWQDAIAQKGSVGIQLADENVKKMGDGTSVLYRYQKDGQNKYFKEEEKVSRDMSGSWECISEKIRKMPDYKEAYSDELDKLCKAVEQQIKGVSNFKYNDKLHSRDVYAQYYKLVVDFMFGGQEGDSLILKAKKKGSLTCEKNPLFNYLAGLDEKSEYGKFAISILEEFFKKLNSDYIAVDTVKIDPGNTLSNRNVATSRMADLLGISHMVMKSETQEVKNGSRKVVGNVMDEADGNAAYDVLADNKVKYSYESVNQIVVMQVFDLICGQTDRSRDNYYLSTTTNEKTNKSFAKDVFMLDNDMSFGNLTDIKAKQGEKRRIGCMVKFNDLLIDTIPPELKETIKKINNYSKGDLGFILGDILSEEEISNLKKRIGMISDAIAERETIFKKAAEERKDTDGKIVECMKDPHFRAIRYQYQLHKTLKAATAANKVKKGKIAEFKSEYIRELSYLQYRNMRPFTEVETEYRKYLQ